MMRFLGTLAVLACVVVDVESTISQIKLAQGLTPTTMTVTWSSTPASTNTQVKYGTSKNSLSLNALGSPGVSYTYQSFMAKARKAVAASTGVAAVAAVPVATLLPFYTSPLIHKAVLNNLMPGIVNMIL